MTNKEEWYSETLHENVQVQYKIDSVIFRDKTEFQDVFLFSNPTFGKMLALDGVIQTAQRDEPAYHEMLTHVPILGHGGVKSVLIIGGGDGGIAREVLKHKNITVTMVELDTYVTDFSKKHLPTLSDGALDNSRLRLLFQDGCKFVKQTTDTYDVIIIDSTDPIGCGAVLFTEEFYTDCKACLNKGGILVSQQGVPMLQSNEIVTTKRRQNPHFADVTFYKTSIATYFGGFMTLGWATDNENIRKTPLDVIEKRFANATLGELHYYTPLEHIASFSLPQFIINILKDV